MTPEMFAEWREPGLNCLNSPAPVERGGGPAFIQQTEEVPFPCGEVDYWEFLRALHDVPPGYIWQPATDHSPAGWVRLLKQPPSIPM